MKKYFILYMICLASLVGCKTGDDLYISPNDPAEPTLSTLLTALEVNVFANEEGELARQSSIFVQHSAGLNAQYNDVQNYFINEGDYDNSWESLYVSTMHNAKILINQAGEENPYYAGVGKVIMAMTIAMTTDLWGDVPFSEALRLDGDGILTPKLDTQEDIYSSIDGLLADAISDFEQDEDDNVFLPGTDDIIHQGDAELWIKTAYTLRARYLNRLSNKANNDIKILEYLSKGISDNSENAEAVHSDTDPNQWGAFQSARPGYIGASKAFVDRLNATSDPRISYYLTKNEADIYVGGDITQEAINPDISLFGSFFATSRNYPLVTYYEAKFIEAEVLERQGSDASTALNDAIKASVEYVTEGDDDGSSIAVYAAPSKTDILTEKWVAMYNHGIEAYNDFRRTGIPALTPRPETVGAMLNVIPKRLPFPKETTLYNPNASFVELDIPVWWAE